MSELHDALNELATRGTPRGADAVLDAAAESAEHDVATRMSAVPNVVDDDDENHDLDTIPFVTTEPVRHRRPMGSMIAAAGLAALLLVGVFAVSAIVGSGGGSGSAEGAVRRLADALSHEDPLAAADVLAPDEVRSLHATVSAAEVKAADLKLVQTAGAPLAGVDFNIDGLKLTTTPLGDGYAKVTIDEGSFSASTHKAQFSPLMQKVLRNSDGSNSTQSNLAQLAASKHLPTFVVAVRQDGRWYVSTAYTVLEYVREASQLPAAEFGSGEQNIATLGADSPDAAVQDSMHALQKQDWSKLMMMVDPREIPVYDYRAALNQLIGKSACDGASRCLVSPGSVSNRSSGFTIDSMTTDAQVNGDTAKVTLRAKGTTSSGTWSLDGGCYSITSNDVRSSSGSATREDVTCGRGFPFLLSPLALPFVGADSGSQFTVEQRNGRWFVSPVGTVLDLVDQAIAQLDRRAVYSTLDIPFEIPADGPLTLAQPIVLSQTFNSASVLSFDGHKGQQLLGLATSSATAGSKPTAGATQYTESPAGLRVFAADGSELRGASDLLSGHALILPADGTYKFVIAPQIYSLGSTGTVTVTVWNAADAPADAKTDRGYSSCTYSLFGSECSSSSSSSSSGASNGVLGPVPTDVAGSGTTAAAPGQSCTTTGTVTTCSIAAVQAPTTSIGNGISVSGNGSGTSNGPASTAGVTTSVPHG